MCTRGFCAALFHSKQTRVLRRSSAFTRSRHKAFAQRLWRAKSPKLFNQQHMLMQTTLYANQFRPVQTGSVHLHTIRSILPPPIIFLLDNYYRVSRAAYVVICIGRSIRLLESRAAYPMATTSFNRLCGGLWAVLGCSPDQRKSVFVD